MRVAIVTGAAQGIVATNGTFEETASPTVSPSAFLLNGCIRSANRKELILGGLLCVID